MKRHIYMVVVAFALLLLSNPAHACAALTKEGEEARQENNSQFLRREADRVVRGVWRLDKSTPDDELVLSGYIEVKKGHKLIRYELIIPQEINCGFPNYDVKNNDFGIFYLKKRKTISNGRSDRVNYNFSFLHFEPIIWNGR